MAKMNFVSTELSMPLYLLSRIPLKEERPERVRDYIKKKGPFYTRKCNLENETTSVTKEKFKHVVGFYKPTPTLTGPQRILKSYDPSRLRTWQLPPNHYEAPREPFLGSKGAGGAYWPKLPKNKSIKKVVKISSKFYNLPRETEKMTGMCCKYKGPFVGNARARRATARNMISDILTCYRNPDDPSPADYYPQSHEIQYNTSKCVEVPVPNPHIFYPQSTVPMKPIGDVPRHISFSAAPGRYEIRYPGVCACVSRRIYFPELHIMVDREKRKKFRRLPYKKIQTRLYCFPDWRHVAGGGFRRLFIMPKPKEEETVQRKKAVHKTDKTYQLFPDAKYFQMINAPKRTNISIRAEPMKQLPPRIFFNCVAKRIVRKQMRNQKKIAFLSGQERFKDMPRPPPLTQRQQDAAKASLPLERQLRDQPIMYKRKSEIESKLTHTPFHMTAFYELELRKPFFKFLPLPPPQLLVTDRDTRGQSIDGQYTMPHFYGKPIEPQKFFK